MPVRSSYTPGTPSWIDLSTSDPAAAQAFYGALLGWEFAASPTDQGGEYIMATLNGETVAGLMQQQPEQAAMGIPSLWNTYVTVTDAEATIAKVSAAGGQVMMPPMDVMDAGRMAVVVDPAGAVICLWQPKDHIGATIVNEAGSLVWNELISTDLAASIAFYADVFGWDGQTMELAPGQEYTSFMLGEGVVAGGMKPPMDGMPSFWGIYFATDDCDATCAKAEELGATVFAPPMDIPVGRMASLADPTGAMFSIIKMNPMDDA